MRGVVRFLCVLAVLVAATTRLSADPTPSSSGAKPTQDEKIKEKLKELHDLLAREFELEISLWEKGDHTVAPAIEAVRSYAKNSQELYDNGKDRAAGLEECMTWAERLQKLAATKLQAGLATRSDDLAVKALLLEIQILQLRENGKGSGK